MRRPDLLTAAALTVAGLLACSQPAAEPAASPAGAEAPNFAGTAATGTDRARNDGRPYVDVVSSVANNRRLTGRTARRMHTHDVVLRNREHIERIRLSQIILYGEWKFCEVLKRRQICGRYACRVAFGPIRRLVLVGVRNRPFETIKLQIA